MFLWLLYYIIFLSWIVILPTTPDNTHKKEQIHFDIILLHNNSVHVHP